MPDLFGEQPITLDDQIAEVMKELVMRGRVYPRLVETGKMKQAAADRKVKVMEAVLATLKAPPS